MKIGVFIGNIPKEEGGGFTFQESVVNTIHLQSSANRHFTIFHYGEIKTKISADHISYQQLNNNSFAAKILNKLKRLRKHLITTPLEKACVVADIDIVWFPSYYYEDTSRPYIYTIWDLQHRLQPLFPELIEGNKVHSRDAYLRSILTKASYVLTGTERGKSEVVTFYNVHPERIALLPHPTPLFVYKSKELFDIKAVNYDEPYLFYPGQFWAHKNHITLLLAIKLMIDKYGSEKVPKVYFVGSEKNTKQHIVDKIKELKLSDHVKILGFVSNEQLVGLYKKASALVYPTLFGPENLPPLEAFALGCPVIASDVPGSDEQYRDAALIFKRFDHVDLAEKITSLIMNTSLRDDLVARGQKISNEYSLQNYQFRMQKIFDDFAFYLRCWK
ncbi:MAG: glycosyltransferase family 1 protein [Bacteroidetes bacterium]|nr:glycosyltransferase family 1 protein [Bacteroidota bacterium]